MARPRKETNLSNEQKAQRRNNKIKKATDLKITIRLNAS